MQSRSLSPRPHLDHLKREAKALHKAIAAGDPEAIARARSALGREEAPKLTDAQRVIAREYGFPTWARLRDHVEAASGTNAAITTFLRLTQENDGGGALAILEQHPGLPSASLHVAATIGNAEEVRRHLAARPTDVRAKAGKPGASPLLFLCFSPFHGESARRDDGLFESAKLLLEAGADPNSTDGQYGVPCLYGVTGYRYSLKIARLLLDAGAKPTDGESLHHSAEHGRIEALDMLLAAGADLNAKGEWGNTPLYFLLHWYDVDRNPDLRRGVEWLLAHGADPNVRCREEQETCLHAAARRGHSPATITMLLEHGADVNARRSDGRTAWRLAKRAGHDAIASMLEARGASQEALSAGELMLAACGRGDVAEAKRLSTSAIVEALESGDLAMLPGAASDGKDDVVRACLAAGFPPGSVDAQGATALHHAAIRGRPAIARTLIGSGASLDLRDPEHHSTPIGWAAFGADFVRETGGDYPQVIRVLLEAGARLSKDEHQPSDSAAREVFAEFQQLLD